VDPQALSSCCTNSSTRFDSKPNEFEHRYTHGSSPVILSGHRFNYWKTTSIALALSNTLGSSDIAICRKQKLLSTGSISYFSKGRHLIRQRDLMNTEYSGTDCGECTIVEKFASSWNMLNYTSSETSGSRSSKQLPGRDDAHAGGSSDSMM